ncbi:MAG: excinuclease ABC subunit UvrA [Alloprevotella sp.]|nr:excinuclease ABC subunit UvrA [Alloprevotella sp.]
MSNIEVYGARVHNLKNVDCQIPRGSLAVVTGLSGSGKSSLAFDTLYAEGQRRYIETFSAYARNFLDNLERPDVDKITGLSPVISIEQKTTNKNPRSTVGTVTEIYDFLRLLYARAGTAYSYVSGEKMVKYTEEKVVSLILDRYEGCKVMLLAPLVRSRKGHYKELFDSVRKKGFLTVRVDGVVQEVKAGMKVDRYKNHDIEVVVDKLRVQGKDEERLKKSVAQTLTQGNGLMLVLDVETNEARYYSRLLMDPVSGISYREPAPNNFSFNSTQGACPKCKGLGFVSVMDKDKVIPDPKLSIRDGGLAPLGKYKSRLIFWEVEAVLAEYGCSLDMPVGELPEEALDAIFNGKADRLHIPAAIMHTTDDQYVEFDGLVKYVRQMADAEMTAASQRWAEQFSKEALCPHCHGQRLNQEALSYRFDGKNIAELSAMDIRELYEWTDGVEERVEKKNAAIAHEILKELRTRLKFLLDVGLDYLSLSRSTMSLSGGESQRIRLATQIGSQLVNVLYILDEPSIGLHQRDNQRLIRSLKELRDIGNTVIVVEHDEDMMRAADYIVDLGPKAGRLGGEVVFQGTPAEMLKANTLTADYLNGLRKVGIPEKRRKGNGKKLRVVGAGGNNLQHITVDFPLGKLICVTGVSGSGKSTLVNDTLLPILSQHFFHSLREPLSYERIEGLENVDKVVAVDQSPIGRTPRSNPATYTGVFTDIRELFVNLPEAKMRGYKPGRFSFNVKGGRCETCKGNGYKTIEMNFLPDVYVPCEECHGKRYNRETLEVRFKGKSISDVLDMTINNAVEFFENVPNILHKIKVLQDVGLGYIKLGQSSTTLSGGESQRVKLATELSKRDTGRTVYILDEPTTGLHFEDIRVLLGVLNRLVDKGNTVIVIEHNLDVIRAADWLIDMGPEGGRGGGTVVVTGTPEQVAESKKGYTGQFL